MTQLRARSGVPADHRPTVAGKPVSPAAFEAYLLSAEGICIRCEGAGQVKPWTGPTPEGLTRPCPPCRGTGRASGRAAA